MANYLPDNEIIEFEDRTYINPQVALDESAAFIDNLRNTQKAQNAEINAQTYNLGTAVPSNLGGLTGGEGYWTSRYQVPQSVSVAANLKAAAQAQALNDALQNELAMQKQRYNKAYKAYQKRNRGGGGGSGGGNGNTSGWGGETEDIISDGDSGYTASGFLSLDDGDFTADNLKYIVEPASGDIIIINDKLPISDPNYQQVKKNLGNGSYGNAVPFQNPASSLTAGSTASKLLATYRQKAEAEANSGSSSTYWRDLYQRVKREASGG